MGQGLELWGKRPSGPPLSSPPERWGLLSASSRDLSLLPADLGKAPRRCFLMYSPSDPLQGHSKSPSQGLALAQPGRSDSVPRSCLAHTSLGLTYNQIKMTAGGNSLLLPQELSLSSGIKMTRKTVWICTCALTPTSVGEK